MTYEEFEEMVTRFEETVSDYELEQLFQEWLKEREYDSLLSTSRRQRTDQDWYN
jgi:hypothetical protein